MLAQQWTKGWVRRTPSPINTLFREQGPLGHADKSHALDFPGLKNLLQPVRVGKHFVADPKILD
ncbi:MAG: hypothetical protein EBT50_02000 [Verrucomicrobia bacterium]|nr:hypothetical protein [Verrucomicrobiota bacterium]